MRRIVSILVPLVTAVSLIATSASAAESGGDRTELPTGTTAGSEWTELTVVVGEIGSRRPPKVLRRTVDASGDAATLSFDPAVYSTQSHSEACFYARPTWTRYNGFGKLSSRAWYYIEWCSLDGVVSRVLTLYCGGVAGGGFSYDGCRVRRGSTGFSKVYVSGWWRFPFRVGLYTFLTRTVTVSASHYATGRYSGTWWLYQ